ncbi:MAG TPA: ABC transporter substrate-binding protein, partial [Desulfovibrio sp.]|nr:ABC transporter substrate-binding protein [Desulfovibrio sp.]
MRARHFPVFVLFFVLILCSCGRSAFAGPVKLIAGTSLITDVLQALCGGNAEILTLVQGSSCPGHEDVKTGDFVFASHADLIVLHAWQERMPQ